jgi:SAM-dependent methyltransferase
VSQIKSRKRVADHGEVFTNPREVNAMLDSVKEETERVESRFLEPACGTGNFLVEILRRKMDAAKRLAGDDKSELERLATVAVANLYGVDILADNVAESRARCLEVVADAIGEGSTVVPTIKGLLECNVIHGDTLECTELDDAQNAAGPLCFIEWVKYDRGEVTGYSHRLSDLLENTESLLTETVTVDSFGNRSVK